MIVNMNGFNFAIKFDLNSHLDNDIKNWNKAFFSSACLALVGS